MYGQLIHQIERHDSSLNQLGGYIHHLASDVATMTTVSIFVLQLLYQSEKRTHLTTAFNEHHNAASVLAITGYIGIDTKARHSNENTFFVSKSQTRSYPNTNFKMSGSSNLSLNPPAFHETSRTSRLYSFQLRKKLRWVFINDHSVANQHSIPSVVGNGSANIRRFFSLFLFSLPEAGVLLPHSGMHVLFYVHRRQWFPCIF